MKDGEGLKKTLEFYSQWEIVNLVSSCLLYGMLPM